MKYNFITHACTRINNISEDELHPCFFCGHGIDTDKNILENMQMALRYCSQKLKNEKKLKLNVGCGMDLREEYINIDLQDIDAVGYRFVREDCGNLPFLRDGVVSEIYAKGLIE